MKALALVLMTLMSGITDASVVYYCSDSITVGIEPDEDNRFQRYKAERFKIGVDWNLPSMNSIGIYLDAFIPTKCSLDEGENGLNIYCSNSLGVSMTLNQETLRYNRSFIFNMHGEAEQDTLILATGTCEQF